MKKTSTSDGDITLDKKAQYMESKVKISWEYGLWLHGAHLHTVDP